MDEDFDDYSFYSKPRLKLAAVKGRSDDEIEAEPSQSLKAAYCSAGVACIALGICTSGVLQFFSFWFALAFLIGPFSPLWVTGGTCSVGLGGDVEFDEDLEEEEPSDPSPGRGSKTPLLKKKGSSDAVAGKLTNGIASTAVSSQAANANAQAIPDSGKGGWTRGEWEQLRSLLVKYPRGTPKRWENVARELKTKRSTEEVIAASKFMSECKDKDPYAAFAAQFKSSEADSKASPLAPSLQSNTEATSTSNSGSKSDWWTEAQDKALLKALKDNPKVEGQTERWDKVAQAVPGRSKGECQKRLTELRDHLRARKAAEGGIAEDEVDAL